MTTGMVIMRPTSIVVAGGGTETASIRAAGGVEFANATSLSLNGVFTSDYDDYMIVIRHVGSVASDNLGIRVRSSGTDATGSNYVEQFLSASSTTVSGARTTRTYASINGTSSTQRSGTSIYLYGPHLAQPTALRSVTCYGASSASIFDNACTHSLSTAYDGFTLVPVSGNFTGLVTVYGLAQ